MNIEYEAICETGLKRESNQDKITAHISNKISVFTVADGMGGHSEGEYASQKVVEAVDVFWEEIQKFDGDFQTVVDCLLAALDQANSDIFEYAASKGIICGSTVSVLIIFGKLYAVINVGDSPVYYADPKTACHASTEHSYDVIMQKSLPISPDMLDKKRKGRLVQAIGVKKSIFPNVRTGSVKDKQIFFICSDGVSRYFTDRKIFKYLKRSAKGKFSLKELVTALKNAVLKSGAEDNFSEIAVLVCNHIEKEMNKVELTMIVIISAMIVVSIFWIVVNFSIIK